MMPQLGASGECDEKNTVKNTFRGAKGDYGAENGRLSLRERTSASNSSHMYINSTMPQLGAPAANLMKVRARGERKGANKEKDKA